MRFLLQMTDEYISDPSEEAVRAAARRIDEHEFIILYSHPHKTKESGNFVQAAATKGRCYTNWSVYEDGRNCLILLLSSQAPSCDSPVADCLEKAELEQVMVHYLRTGLVPRDYGLRDISTEYPHPKHDPRLFATKVREVTDQQPSARVE